MIARGDVRWNEAGLAPAVIQDAGTGRVLMLGWMNAEALVRTLETGRVHFWSRSRRTLWKKGETSGNELRLRSLALDCDRDALLVRADPAGPTCHTGATSCFFRGEGADGFGEVLGELARIVEERAKERPEGSYTARLLEAGVLRTAQKVGEEGVETALAGAADDDGALVSEAADLLYHLLVLLRARDVAPEQVSEELRRRFPAPSSPPAA